MLIRYFSAIVFLALTLLGQASASEVIVNKSVSVQEATQSDIRSIFTMQKRIWHNKKQIAVFVLAEDSQTHKDFVKNILQMFPHHLRKIWDRLVYSGTGTIPIEVDSEQEMIEKIANTPNSIGYVNKAVANENIHVFNVH